MKKSKTAILAAMLATGVATNAQAELAEVLFENYFANGSVTIGPNTGPSSYAINGTYTVALLWGAGTSFVPQSSLTQLTTFNPGPANPTSFGNGTDGAFLDSYLVNIPDATPIGASAIFEVQGWSGNFSSYAAAIAGGAQYVGQTAEFVNPTGPGPNGDFVYLQNWDGNLVLVPTPEPGTLALTSLAAAAWLYFRRSK